MLPGLDSLVGDTTGVLAQLTKVGDSVNSAVGRASGWDSLLDPGVPRPSGAAPVPSASAGASDMGGPLRALRGVSGVVMVGGLALGALVVWAVFGRR